MANSKHSPRSVPLNQAQPQIACYKNVNSDCYDIIQVYRQKLAEQFRDVDKMNKEISRLHEEILDLGGYKDVADSSIDTMVEQDKIIKNLKMQLHQAHEELKSSKTNENNMLSTPSAFEKVDKYTSTENNDFNDQYDEVISKQNNHINDLETQLRQLQQDLLDSSELIANLSKVSSTPIVSINENISSPIGNTVPVADNSLHVPIITTVYENKNISSSSKNNILDISDFYNVSSTSNVHKNEILSTPTKNTDSYSNVTNMSTQTNPSAKKRKPFNNRNRFRCHICDERGHNVRDCPYAKRLPIKKLKTTPKAVKPPRFAKTPSRFPKLNSSSFSTPKRSVHPFLQNFNFHSAPPFVYSPPFTPLPVMNRHPSYPARPFQFTPPPLPFWMMYSPPRHHFAGYYSAPPYFNATNFPCQLCDTTGHSAKSCSKFTKCKKNLTFHGFARASSSHK